MIEIVGGGLIVGEVLNLDLDLILNLNLNLKWIGLD
jgi:hypothetical protein